LKRKRWKKKKKRTPHSTPQLAPILNQSLLCDGKRNKTQNKKESNKTPRVPHRLFKNQGKKKRMFKKKEQPPKKNSHKP